MACQPFIADDFLFPRPANNRPALPHIAYRIGRYGDFYEQMLRHIDAAEPLLAFTHREPDDPAIALLQGAAIVGDILSFYQEHYANEAYLRTAQWRDSVADLVRLTGYRLAPGLGGRATLAIEVRGTAPVTVRAGWPVKADLADVPDQADFRTVEELVAQPALSRFHLYRRRIAQPLLAAGGTHLELSASAQPAAQLKKGDRLLLMSDESMYSSGGASWTPQKAPQIVTIATVTPHLDRVRIELEHGPSEGWTAPLRAVRIGRTLRHFGHNAPATVTTPITGSGGAITGSSSAATRFERYIYAFESTYYFGDAYTTLDWTEMPLDVEAPDLAAGRRVIVQGRIHFDGQPTPVPFAVTKTITATRAGTVRWGNLQGASTVLTLDSNLIVNGNIHYEMADIRDLRFLEITSPELSLTPPTDHATGDFTSGTAALLFYGTAAEVQQMGGRRLWLAAPDGRNVELVCTNTSADFAFAAFLGASVASMWPLSFDRPPLPFTQQDFDEDTVTVTVYGNLVDATQGKAEADATLGNGDATQAFQTFTLPKSPLTYDLAPDGTLRPALQVWVGGRLWTQVDALFGAGPTDEVYIVREDADGRSHVQFGDGETGARLPSGVGNVVARYRSGNGARGPMKPGAVPSAPERPAGFDKVNLAGIVSGGADPEDASKAREAAPGKVQSLGRIVSLRDVETEVLSIAGVVAAAAAWDLDGGVPAVMLRVLLRAGREDEFAAVRAAVVHALRCRGPNRWPVVIEQAVLRYVWLDLAYARDPTYPAADVAAAIRTELGLAEDESHRTGLFSLSARRLGEREYASRIEGRVQNVPGVLWCRVVADGLLAGGVQPAPAKLQAPLPPRPRIATLRCAARELLQLSGHHLTLTESAEPSAGECA
ncbi:hypothetical protein [Pelomonas cellulosilytica]|uniref:Baseplate assembly protein n=1 Tax=Pelomonas cellulosilytica TaxID=2906762 RepID=A0ABS8XYJ1_9BURK|nr:hypothetical protein [Pelomonas sp. P8]MCE4555809.1 hypothetical protein [Pelomonas sp. P8]